MRLKSDPQRYFHWSTASASKIVWRYEEKFQIFLGLALTLLMIEALISERKKV